MGADIPRATGDKDLSHVSECNERQYQILKNELVSAWPYDPGSTYGAG
jgi:hypothetical protein